jgi:hypothetical protein
MNDNIPRTQVKLPIVIKEFEESKGLVDFFKTPSHKRETVSSQDESPKSDENDMNISSASIESTASASDFNATGKKATKSNLKVITPQIDMEEKQDNQHNISNSLVSNTTTNSSSSSSSSSSNTNRGWRESIRAILYINGDDGKRCGRYCSAAKFYNNISFVINIIAIIVEVLKNTRDFTKDGRRPWYPKPYPTPRLLRIISIILGGLFAVELLLRFIVAEAWWAHKKSHYHLMTGHPDPMLNDRYNRNNIQDGSIHGKELPFFKNIFNILDALSIGWWETSLFRVLRVLRLTTRWDSSVIVYDTLRKSAKPICVSMMYLLSFLTLIASILFFVESCYYNTCELPDLVSTTYFLVITITTVGYGDIVPSSLSGRIIAIAVMLTGSFFLAMPLSIIGTEFERAFSKHEKYLAERDKTGKLMRQLERREQRVSIQQRRIRAMQLGYKLADVIEENYESKRRRQKTNAHGKLTVAQSKWQLKNDRDM